MFANAASARAIPMAKDQAREFDARLNSFGRQVSNEVHFKVIGKGDPVGGVLGDLVIRAEITSDRVLDKAGQVLFAPRVLATSAMPAFAGFDASKADVAGLRIGVSKKDMEATLTRLFGTVTPGYMSGGGFKGFAGAIEVNSLGCASGMGREEEAAARRRVCDRVSRQRRRHPDGPHSAAVSARTSTATSSRRRWCRSTARRRAAGGRDRLGPGRARCGVQQPDDLR